MGRPKALADRLNIGTKDEMEVMGFRLHKVKLALTVVLTICTGGLLLILITWKPSIKLNLTHKRCLLHEATRLLLKDIYHQLWEEEVVEEDVPEGEGSETRKRLYFINRKMKYVWDETTFNYARLRPVEHGSTFHSFHRQASGLSGTDAKSKKLLYGDNFMKIESLSIWQLLVQQAVNPFYIFQAYTVILWCLQEYYLFSSCILSLSVISISVMVYETRRQICALRKRITTESDVVVLRDGTRNIISSREIVPGDVVLLKDGLGAMEVDAVLLEGSVVTNEAMLTGESIPVTKVAIPKENDTMFNDEDHKHHLLFSGTEVLQVRGGKELRALVVKTGFYTERGELVRSILFPKPVDIHFYRDFMKMLFLFIFLGLSTMCWSLVHFYYTGASWEEVLFYSLDLVTFVVPPLLPATLTAINIGAQMRLKKHGIFCLSSNYISLSGSVDVVCFDKTGTLTENDLALAGVVSCQRGEMQSPQEDLATLSPDLPLTVALATCHSLTTIDGALAGHPLDIKIFSGIDWTLTEPEAVVNQDYGMVPSLLVQPKHSESIRFPDEHEVAILKTFPFDSKEQRMTVVTRRKTSTNYQVYIKGAPEKIVSICKANSVPDLVETVLEWYTRQGLRVVAVAGASLPSNFTFEQVELTAREQLESGAEFLGLVVLQNKVKLETPSVISTLHQANINTVMITGDNLLTAVSVARQSLLLEAEQQLIVVRAQMVDTSSIAAQHLQVNYYDVDQINGLYDKRKLISVRNDNYVLAADGNTFELIYRGQDKDLFRRLVHKGKIFARMKPDQKMTVVETLQDLGHQVAMCGDGCNDCGALKVADAGISLSSSEASVAAPFTSKYENIDCVPTLIREGRAVLVSVFNAFKYDVSMCFGALICVIFQFLINTMPSDTQYLIMDLILGTMPALVIGITGAPSQLSPTPPTQRILSILPALSMLSFLGIQAVTYWGVLAYIKAQPWFEPFQFDGEMYPITPSYENTALILVNFHSFYIGVLVYSHAYPHRKHIYTNYLLSAYLVCAAFFCMFSTFYTGEWMLNLLNFHPFPDAYTPTMIFLAVSISCFVSLIWERWVLYGLLDKYLLPWIHKTCGPHRPFAKIEKELRNTPDWPPLTDPPQLDAPISTKEGRPLTAKESLPFEEDNDDSMLIRKLTRRNKFKASVKYMKDTTYTPSPEVTSPSTINSPPIQSAGYQVPWDAQQNEGNVFSFNKSVRHQIMQGTGGAFKTFKGSTKKRQRSADSSGAEPYEIIHLTDNNEPIYNDDEIYSTIPDPPPSYTEDVETGVTGNHAGTYGEQEHEVPIYEEGEASKPNTFSGAGSNFEEQPRGGHSIYDVPQPPRPLEKQTRGPAEEVNMGNLPTLMSQLSYIDDEQTESNC